jgi:MobA/VirD2-like, nuclease domain
MIIKSMSRKVPSFGQLLGYIDRDEDGQGYTLRHNLMGRDPDRIRAEFEANGELLQKRKNGVYLYHEIISITRAQELSPEDQKARLYEIAQTYVDARCPDNMVYGGLHQDKEHSYHMHLMISANRAGETKRLRLTKAQFREVQVNLERHVLEHYPELEQKVAIEKQSDRGRGKEEAELERRTGKRPKREEVLARVMAAFEQSDDKMTLLDALGRENLELYVRGKNLGVIDHESGKKHRLKTLDLDMADRIAIRMEGQDQDFAPEEPELEEDRQQDTGSDQVEPEQAVEPEKSSEGEKEKAAKEKRQKKTRKRDRGDRSAEKSPERRKRREQERPSDEQKKPGGTEHEDRESDNQAYVKYGSSTDLKSDALSKQEKSKRKKRRAADKIKERDMSNPVPPNKSRQELIDKGHIEADPSRDLQSLEDWKEQDSFLGKVKQSMRRTFDDLRGRTENLEEKARGSESTSSRTKSPEATHERAPDRSEQQDKWRAEMRQRRDRGRDGPDRGRE